MEKKLYIPTTTLNFNNIMSSESMSPCSFYQLKGYGFKRFDKVKANNLDNAILLYDKYPKYEIQDEGLENYKMVIEICTNSCSAHIEEIGNGIYMCRETIYINPFDTLIYFDNSSELLSTKSKSEPSIETKLSNLYNACYKVYDKSIEKGDYDYDNIQDVNLNEEALEKDIRINKLKGFLFAYIIANNKSCNAKVANLKMHIKQLQNKLSAIITASEFKNIHLNSLEVTSLYDIITSDICNINQENINQVIKEKEDEYSYQNLLSFLQKEELYEQFSRKYTINDIERFVLYNDLDKLAKLDDYGNYLNKFVCNVVKNKPLLSLEKLPVLNISSNRQIINDIPGEKEGVVRLFNMYIDEKINKDEFYSNRYNYALEGGKVFMEIMGDKWKNSKERDYINQLLNNLRDYTSFEINSTENSTLRSFAVFFQKGDIEIEKLENYLISQGIGDLRIAFSLWGIIFGFAEMPKTITCELFDKTDIIYVSSIYKSIYKSLFNIELLGELQRLDNYGFVKNNENVETVNEQTNIHTDYPEYLNNLLFSKMFQELDYKVKEWYKRESIVICSEFTCLSEELCGKLLELKDNCPIKGTKGKWESVIKELKLSIKGKSVRKNNQLTTKDKRQKKLFEIQEYNADFILNLSTVKKAGFDEKQKDRLKQNWEYVKKEHKGKEDIEHFINLCKKEGREGNKVLKGKFTNELGDSIKKELENILHNE